VWGGLEKEDGTTEWRGINGAPAPPRESARSTHRLWDGEERDPGKRLDGHPAIKRKTGGHGRMEGPCGETPRSSGTKPGEHKKHDQQRPRKGGT